MRSLELRAVDKVEVASPSADGREGWWRDFVNVREVLFNLKVQSSTPDHSPNASIPLFPSLRLSHPQSVSHPSLSWRRQYLGRRLPGKLPCTRPLWTRPAATARPPPRPASPRAAPRSAATAPRSALPRQSTSSPTCVIRAPRRTLLCLQLRSRSNWPRRTRMTPLGKLAAALPNPCASRRACVPRLSWVLTRPSRRTAARISSSPSLPSTWLKHAATKAGAKPVGEGRERSRGRRCRAE